MSNNSPYKAYRVYIWDEKYASIVYATSPSKAKAYYYSAEGADESIPFFEAVSQMTVRRVKEFDQGIPNDDSLDYANEKYNKSFKIGQRVRVYDEEGWILKGRGPHVVVGFGDNCGNIYHPNDVIPIDDSIP